MILQPATATMTHAYTIYPLGDSAVTIDLGNRISAALNGKAVAMHQWLNAHRFNGLTDMIIAYSSLCVFYDAATVMRQAGNKSAFQFVRQALHTAYASADNATVTGRTVQVPVCYAPEVAPDLQLVATEKNLTTDEVIALHTGVAYRVYMTGFLPGFPYMAHVDERIFMFRKQRPRAAVAAGSVGLAGWQTGIYPVQSPGGWQIIGRTPLSLFDRHHPEHPVIRPGDQVTFYPIDLSDYQQRLLASTTNPGSACQ